VRVRAPVCCGLDRMLIASWVASRLSWSATLPSPPHPRPPPPPPSNLSQAVRSAALEPGSLRWACCYAGRFLHTKAIQMDRWIDGSVYQSLIRRSWIGRSPDVLMDCAWEGLALLGSKAILRYFQDLPVRPHAHTHTHGHTRASAAVYRCTRCPAARIMAKRTCTHTNTSLCAVRACVCTHALASCLRSLAIHSASLACKPQNACVSVNVCVRARTRA
jgi:hypothetical protein